MEHPNVTRMRSLLIAWMSDPVNAALPSYQRLEKLEAEIGIKPVDCPKCGGQDDECKACDGEGVVFAIGGKVS